MHRQQPATTCGTQVPREARLVDAEPRTAPCPHRRAGRAHAQPVPAEATTTAPLRAAFHSWKPDRRDWARHRPSPRQSLAEDFPGVLLFGLAPEILAILEHILGQPPSLAELSLPCQLTDGREGGSRLWLMDTEDCSVGRIILPLDDVDAERGPFEYVEPARRLPALLARNREVIPAAARKYLATIG
jgi:hypothetical protein